MSARLIEVVLPVSLNYATLDSFRHQYWLLHHASDIDAMMQLWMTAAAALPYTGDIGQSVVDTLLQMASDRHLLSHIPVLAWDWLKKRPLLHPECKGLRWGTDKEVVQTVRKLGDVGLITSYLFIVWSKWSWILHPEFQVMLRLVREELSGIGAAGYRADLIQRLDDILPQLESRFGERKQQYEELRTALVEVDEKAMKTLTGMSHSRRSVLFTNVCMCRRSLYLHVCASSSVPVVACRPPGTHSSN